MITQYSNINEILEAPSSISAQRFTITDRNTFIRNSEQFLFGNINVQRLRGLFLRNC